MTGHDAAVPAGWEVVGMLSSSASELALSVPGFFRLWHEREAWLIIVCVSIAVRPDDRIFRPAAELLARFEAVLVTEEYVPDESVLMGTARLMTYRVNAPPEVLEPRPAPVTDWARAA